MANNNTPGITNPGTAWIANTATTNNTNKSFGAFTPKRKIRILGGRVCNGITAGTLSTVITFEVLNGATVVLTKTAAAADVVANSNEAMTLGAASALIIPAGTKLLFKITADAGSTAQVGGVQIDYCDAVS